MKTFKQHVRDINKAVLPERAAANAVLEIVGRVDVSVTFNNIIASLLITNGAIFNKDEVRKLLTIEG